MDNLKSRQRSMFSKSKHRAKKCGEDWNLMFEDVKWNTTCIVTELPIDFLNKGGRSVAAYNSPALVRVDKELGWVKGNVLLVSVAAAPIFSKHLIKYIKHLLGGNK